jgi:integrase
MVQRHAASLVVGKPPRPEGREDVLHHGWEAEEARRFMAAAKELGAQSAAFYTLALDGGARKGELCGLKWTDLALDAGTVAIVRQLIKPGVRAAVRPTEQRGEPDDLHCPGNSGLASNAQGAPSGAEARQPDSRS